MLASSQSETEKLSIREQMSRDSALKKILAQLDTGKADDDVRNP